MRNVSIVTDLNGDKMILIDEAIFEGKKSINWDDVRAYLRSYMGELYEMTDTRDIVYTGNNLPDGYTSSKYTYPSKGANIKAEVNAPRGIPQMLETVVGKHFRENSGEKHQKNTANGWYRYGSRFVLPVYGDSGKVDHYNIFHASMLVHHASGGKVCLYDVLDVKKETSNPFKS